VNSELESSATTRGTWAPLVLARTLRALKTAVGVAAVDRARRGAAELRYQALLQEQAFFMGGRRGVGRHGRGVCLVASAATEDIWLS
jgi:hypothetical protein